MSKKAYSSQEIIDLPKAAGFVLDRVKHISSPCE